MHTGVIAYKAFHFPEPFTVIEIKIGCIFMKTGQCILFA